MKKFRTYFFYALLVVAIPTLILSSCKDEAENDAFETLKTYVEENNLDLPDMLNGWIQKDQAYVDSVQNDADATNDYFIIDIRKEADYNAGHIKGAVNTTLAGVLTTAELADGKDILVVCYTGQTAGHANMALRLKGYSSQVLIWGMSGWHTDFDKWTANVGDAGSSNWIAAPGDVTATAEFEAYPEIVTEETEGEAILDERINKLLTEGFQGVENTDVLASPGNYFINNYWDEADVTEYGNISGAYRIKPFGVDQLKNIDADETIVTYCWTGQTSSMITAWLYIMGYDAKSLKFGANGMIYSDLHSHKWSAPKDYSYE